VLFTLSRAIYIHWCFYIWSVRIKLAVRKLYLQGSKAYRRQLSQIHLFVQYRINEKDSSFGDFVKVSAKI